MRLKSVMLLGGALIMAQGAQAQDGSSSTVLTSGWGFVYQGEGTASAPDASGSWQNVSLPHSWNRIGQYEPQAGVPLGQRAVDKKMGVGWYRLDLAAPDLSGGRHAFLQFDAASRLAEVWLNGQKIGDHAGSFSRFRFDITKVLKSGQTNLLIVRVDNSPPKEGSATADILPLTGDFFIQGGLYRPVSLIVTAPAHFDLMDDGGSGVYAQTDAIAPQASVSVTARLRNDSASTDNLILTTRLVDAEGKVAASSESRVRLKPATTLEAKQALQVASPHLWQGTSSPYLYHLVSELRNARGTVLDRSEQDFGIRQIRIDPDKGLFLNGVHTPLHGAALHQDGMGTGWAMGEKDIASVVDAMRDMGANTLRLAHYQHGQTIHQLADRYGLILWDEIPFVTLWTNRKGQLEPTAALIANGSQQLRELIAQNRNHPSVAVWGIANEVDFGPNLPGFLNNGNGVAPDPTPLLRELNTLAHRLDPSRPTTLATCCEEKGQSGVPPVADITDVSGANRYFGWYYGKKEELGAHLDVLHAKRPHQPLAVTEYGGGGALSLHTDNVDGGPIDAFGRAQPEEYQAAVHEAQWPQLAARPYLWATWIWNGYDFGTTVRREGDAVDINTKGLVSYDGAIRKDAFYYYRAQWSTQPTLHIAGRRATSRAYRVTDVKVYSNGAETELLLNGRSLGVQQSCANHVCLWRNVTLDAGDNKLDARSKHGDSVVFDTINWTLAADQASVYRIDAGSVLAAGSAQGRFGSDNFFLGGHAATMDQTPLYRPPVLAQISGTQDQALMSSYRAGNFSYHLPLAAGRYRVSLSFAEPAAKPSERVFDVRANGKNAITALDVAQSAGSLLSAITRSFDVTVEGDGLTLQFVPSKGEAMVSAIVVEPVKQGEQGQQSTFRYRPRATALPTARIDSRHKSGDAGDRFNALR